MCRVASNFGRRLPVALSHTSYCLTLTVGVANRYVVVSGFSNHTFDNTQNLTYLIGTARDVNHGRRRVMRAGFNRKNCEDMYENNVFARLWQQI